MLQARGLPHAHILIILEVKILCSRQIDKLICAEIPNPTHMKGGTRLPLPSPSRASGSCAASSKEPSRMRQTWPMGCPARNSASTTCVPLQPRNVLIMRSYAGCKRGITGHVTMNKCKSGAASPQILRTATQSNLSHHIPSCSPPP